MYVAMRLHRKFDVDVALGLLRQSVSMPVSELAEGVCGALLVFETAEQARKYGMLDEELFEVRFRGVDTLT